MRIGIDIDGVLTDIAKFIADYGSKFCYDNHIQYMIKDNEYDETKALNITDKQAERFWNTYLEFYATQYPIRDFASEVIKKLKLKHEIYIITARNEYGLPKKIYGTMKNMVKKWLEQNYVEYDKLIFTIEDKLSCCIENQIDIMIEDSPHNILNLSTTLPVLCYDNPYNKMIEGKNIVRVYSWYNI